MRTTAITLIEVLAVTPVIANAAENVRDLIKQETNFDRLCRGTDNNNACIARQKLVYRYWLRLVLWQRRASHIPTPLA